MSNSCPWSDAHGQQQYSNRLLYLTDDWLALMATNCAKKHSPHKYATSTSLDSWHKEGLGPWILAASAKFWPYHLCDSAKIKIHQTRLHISSLRLFSFGEPVPTTAWTFYFWLIEEEPNMVFCCCNHSSHVHSSKMLSCSFQFSRVGIWFVQF